MGRFLSFFRFRLHVWLFWKNEIQKHGWLRSRKQGDDFFVSLIGSNFGQVLAPDLESLDRDGKTIYTILLLSDMV